MQCVVLAAADSVDDHHRCDREASKVVTGWQKKPFLVASMGFHHVGQHYSVAMRTANCRRCLNIRISFECLFVLTRATRRQKFSVTAFDRDGLLDACHSWSVKLC